MRALVQRVSRARVTVDDEITGEIGPGLVALVGVTHDDGEAQASKLADKIDISGELWTEPNGEGKLDRCVTMNIKVKIFGVGKVVEGFIEKTTRESYDRATDYTNGWLAEQGY